MNNKLIKTVASLPKKPILKNQLLEDLYLQLVEEIHKSEESLINVDQTTIISTDKFIFELKFKKKLTRELRLIEGD